MLKGSKITFVVVISSHKFSFKTLRLKNIMVVVFLLVNEVFQLVSANSILYVFLMCVVIWLMIALTICSYVRIYVLYKFTKALKDDNAFLNIN
jgi:hypothetical protein